MQVYIFGPVLKVAWITIISDKFYMDASNFHQICNPRAPVEFLVVLGPRGPAEWCRGLNVPMWRPIGPLTSYMMTQRSGKELWPFLGYLGPLGLE